MRYLYGLLGVLGLGIVAASLVLTPDSEGSQRTDVLHSLKPDWKEVGWENTQEDGWQEDILRGAIEGELPGPSLANLKEGDVIPTKNGRFCTIRMHYFQHDDGTVTQSIACESNFETPPSRFDHLDNDSLAVMAYNDAGASEELAMRVYDSDPPRARELMLNSVALDPSDARPLAWIGVMSYGTGRINGALVVHDLHERYILLRLAQTLGYSSTIISSVQEDLIEAGYQDADFEALEAQVAEDLSWMRDVQLSVTGQTTIAEARL